MRSKEEIFNDLKKTRQDDYGTYLDGPPPEVLILEVFIDIRDAIITDVKDALNALIEIRKTH